MRAVLLWAVLLVVTSVAGRCQDGGFSLTRYGIDINEINQGIQQKISQQMCPVGLESQGQEMFVLYLHNSRVGAKSWKLQPYKDMDSFHQGLSEGIKEGFTPVDVSYEPDRLYVLSLKLEEVPEAWSWVVTPTDSAEIQKSLDSWIAKGYQPMGITRLPSNLATLVVRFRNRPAQAWKMDSFANMDEVSTGMAERLAQGQRPWGLITGGKSANVMFVLPTPAVDGWQASSEPPMSLPEIEEFILKNYCR